MIFMEQQTELFEDKLKCYKFTIQASCKGVITISAKTEEEAKEYLKCPNDWEDNYFYDHKVEDITDTEIEE